MATKVYCIQRITSTGMTREPRVIRIRADERQREGDVDEFYLDGDLVGMVSATVVVAWWIEEPCQDVPS